VETEALSHWVIKGEDHRENLKEVVGCLQKCGEEERITRKKEVVPTPAVRLISGASVTWPGLCPRAR